MSSVSNVQVDLVEYVGEYVKGDTHYTHYQVVTPAPKKPLPAQRSYSSFNNYLNNKPKADLRQAQAQEIHAMTKAIIEWESIDALS